MSESQNATWIAIVGIVGLASLRCGVATNTENSLCGLPLLLQHHQVEEGEDKTGKGGQENAVQVRIARWRREGVVPKDKDTEAHKKAPSLGQIFLRHEHEKSHYDGNGHEQVVILEIEGDHRVGGEVGEDHRHFRLARRQEHHGQEGKEDGLFVH